MVNHCFVILLLVLFSNTHTLPTFNQYQIQDAERNVQLSSAYPQQLNEFNIQCIVSSCPSQIYYTIPEEYASQVNKINFRQSKSSTKNLYTWSVQKYVNNEKSYDLYKVDIGKTLSQGQTFKLFIQVLYINRYINYPKAITLSEDQKFEYEDNIKIVSPYLIKKSQITYKFSKILNFDPSGTKKGISSVVFKQTDTQAFTDQKHKVHGVNNQPQVVFSEVQRIIEVSHWGNIAITEFYKLKNIGPQPKGQFSRIQFGSQNSFQSKNAFRGIKTQLPYQIWGLYYRDEVGNISTSRAYRDHHNNQVKFQITPRYSLLGSWKCNWEIGYNLPTKGFLRHDGNQFSLSNVPIQYALNTILTQKFTTRVILPQGSSKAEFLIEGSSVKAQNVEQSLSFGYLDSTGRPSYKIQNVKGILKNKELEVKYYFDETSILKKPLLIFGAIFSSLLAIIILKRLNLDTFTQNAKKDN